MVVWFVKVSDFDEVFKLFKKFKDVFDYVFYRFYKWFLEFNRIFLVVEKGIEVVGFVEYFIVDGEKLVFMEVGRVDFNYRCYGIFGLLRVFIFVFIWEKFLKVVCIRYMVWFGVY